MPTALKLEVLMDELKEKRDRPLAELTALDVAVVTRCKKLLWYPRKFQNMMLYANPANRVKADFFIELYPIVTDRTIRKSADYDAETIIHAFLHKYNNRLSGIRSVTDFRKIKQYLTIARKVDKETEILRRFEVFLSDDTKDISYLEMNVARIHGTATALVKTAFKVRASIDSLDAKAYIGEEALWVELEHLYEAIRKALTAADRRLK